MAERPIRESFWILVARSRGALALALVAPLAGLACGGSVVPRDDSAKKERPDAGPDATVRDAATDRATDVAAEVGLDTGFDAAGDVNAEDVVDAPADSTSAYDVSDISDAEDAGDASDARQDSGGPCGGQACTDFPVSPLNDPAAPVTGNPATLFASDAAADATAGGPCLAGPER
jgi:hypothetical protein